VGLFRRGGLIGRPVRIRIRMRLGPSAVGAFVSLLPIVPPPALANVVQVSVSSTAALRAGTSAPAVPIKPGFVGASIDYCAISRYNPGASADPVLSTLLAALAPEGPVLRVGGPGPESGCPNAGNGSIYFATPAIKALAQQLNAALILGVNLESGRAEWARFQVATLLRGIDPGPRYHYARAFEIGNEPDLLPRYGAYGHATKVIGWFTHYLRDFNYWSRIVRRVAGPGFGIAGPSLGDASMNWVAGGRVRNLTRLLDSAAKPRYVTFHRYALLGPTPCPNPGCPAIDQLLADSSSHGLATTLLPLIARVPPNRVIRVDEMNSVTGGGRAGVSDTFASALWALDTCFELAQAGVQGVNFHTFPTAAYALFSGPQGANWFVHPEYYGLLTFEHAAPAGSQLLSVTPQPASSGGPNVKVWATHATDGKTRLTLINKDAQDFDVQLSGSALPTDGTAALQRLSAPPTLRAPSCPAAYVNSGVCATKGITLGGQTFGPPADPGSGGGDQTTTGTLPAAQSIGPCSPLLLSPACDQPIISGSTTVTVPAGSAVLLTVG
jgi:hypothetical protein